ncbi:hypothetical protein [Kitasatospora purpeofusca]|uniref:hypothetical protein n=1 Tax=Kitasatospora purpeofusca TaxID=67352 RepID=UPI00225237EF|nr:hypothetical protein [Kitasatospora purpeofusca]MCX4757692.1 hypothetical protein [Kitasatospora purpeofusca]WSR34600.1 hypothetical protein OG715_28720 [Kitasatospora purpeofusca]
MRVLAYELRRVRGLRSTWLLLGLVVVCNAVVAGVLAGQVGDRTLGGAAAVRLLTAAVPLVPLPFAALGAGVLGALAYGHEVRHRGLAASQVSYPRRVRLLTAKLTVTGALAAMLALVTLLVDAVTVHFALPAGVTVAAWSDPAALSARVAEALAPSGPGGLDMLPPVAAPLALVAGQGAPTALLAFVLLVVVAGWTGVLTAALTRSATAGVLLLCALPPLLESAVALVLRQSGTPWPARAAELLPFPSGIEWACGWVYGGDGRVAGGGAVSAAPALTDPVLQAAAVAPVLVLLLVTLVVQARRRAL